MTSEDTWKAGLFGPGPLGIGLVGDRLGFAGIPIHLVGREGAPGSAFRHVRDNGQFEVWTPGEVANVAVAATYALDQPADRTRLRDTLVRPGNTLAVTAIRSGQPDAAALLTDAINRRYRDNIDGTFVVMPCENTVAPELAAVRTLCEQTPRCVYLDTMVDRICNAHPRRIGTVLAERDWEWAAQSHPSNTPEPVRRLATRLGVNLVADITATRERKLLMMNGVQACLALRALAFDQPTLQHHLGTSTGRRDLRDLLFEYGTDLADRQPSLTDLQVAACQSWYEQRILDTTDTPERILASLLDGHLAPSLAVLNKRVVETYDNLNRILGPHAANNSVVAQVLAGYFGDLPPRFTRMRDAS